MGEQEEQILLEKYLDEDSFGEEEFLEFINNFIEEDLLRNIISDVLEDDLEYLKGKHRELRWLAAKTRFRTTI